MDDFKFTLFLLQLLHFPPTAWRLSSLRPVRTRVAPNLANNSAVAAPMPELAPVINYP
jgi:hypothetical protein